MSNIDFDSIRRQIDIVNVINSYIPLSPAGRNFKGICPFHNDSNPSMMVSPEKQIYKCFSCGATGNVFTFVSEYEKITFIEAVKKACDIQGIRIPELESMNTFVKKVDNKNERMIKLMSDLCEFYRYQLLINSQSEANKYLESRYLTKEIVDEFKIGFCPSDGNASIKYLLNKGYSASEIIACGVGSEMSDGRVIDKERGRIIFPLCDEYGRVVAFSGRRINNDLEQKYLNTPETNIFHKSEVLYNFHRASKVAKQTGYVYIVEGFMDAISLYRAGISSVVATMGTAFTNEHLKMLSSLRVELRLLFDCDNAGQKAAFKTLDTLKDIRVPVKVVKKWNNGKDADEILNTLGKEILVDYITKLLLPLEFRFQYLKSYYDLANYEDRKKFATYGANYIAKANLDALDLEHYIKVLSDESSFSKDLIRKMVASYTPKKEDDPYQEHYVEIANKTKTTKYFNKYELAARMLIKQMINDPFVVVPAYENSDVFIENNTYQTIINFIISKFYSTGNVVYADLFSDLPKEIADTLVDIYDTDYVTNEPLETLIKILKDEYLEHLEKKELEEKGYETSSINEQLAIAQQLLAKMKEKDSLRKKKK